MSNDNEKLLAEYPAVWSAHDIDKVQTFFTDDCVYADPTLGVVKHGKKGVVEFAEEVFSMQPDFHLEYSEYFATETKGAAVWTITNTWNGEFHGIDVTGKKVNFTGTTIFEFKNGKISKNTDYWDLTPLMLQLGVMTTDLRACK
jgi:steroid delta-isomerase-like uncharacterized protein